MDAPEIKSDPPTVPSEVPAEAARLSAWRRGALAGFWGTTWIVGPIAGVFGIIGLALLAFGLASGQGLGIHPMLTGAMAVYLACVLLFMIFGAIIGATVGLIARVFPGSSRRARADRPVPLPSRRRPWLVGVPVALTVLLLAIAAGVGFFLGGRVDRRLSAAIADADRDDPHWRIRDLMAHREPVPDEENSAIVVAEVVDSLPRGWPPSPPTASGQIRPTSEVLRAWDRCVDAADNVRLDDATAGTLRDELKSLDDAVRLARTVADLDRGRHELVLGPTLIDTPLLETQKTRDAARLLQADAAIRAQDGDLDGALDSCRALIGVGRSIGDEPFSISQLVRVSIGAVALKSLGRVLGQGEPSDAALARLQVLVLDEREQPLLLHAMRGERATMDEILRRLAAGEMPIDALSDGMKPFVPGGPRNAIAPWGKLLYNHQREVGLEWMNQAVAIARRPPAERPALWDARQAEFDRLRHSPLDLYLAALPMLMMPASQAFASAIDRYEAGFAAAAILIAAERHRLKRGDWPATIEAIDRAILPDPPIDPYSGKPFLIDRPEGQFIVHSIGPNHKDEHGRYEPKRWGRGGADDLGSIAWDAARRRLGPPPPVSETPEDAGPTGPIP